MSSVLFNDEEYQQILNEFDQLMQEAEALPYPNAKELLFSILKYFDSIHREPLARLIGIIGKKHPDLYEQINRDFSVKTLLNLYELVEETPTETSGEIKSAGFVDFNQVTILTPVKKTEWIELGKIDDFSENIFYPKNFNKVNFLISRIGERVYAVQNSCVDSILPIDLGKLDDHHIICPWHGCRYDLRTGDDPNRPGRKLETYPVEFENGNIKVGITIQ